MIDSYFRVPYQKIFVGPLIDKDRFSRVHPYRITLVATCFGIAILPLLYFHYSKFAFISLLLSGYFDTLDGSIARKYKKTSKTGAALDIFSDRLCEFCILFGLLLFDLQRSIVCFFMLGSVLLCITSFLVVGIFSENTSEKSFHYSPGIIERTEAFLFFALMILIPNWFYPLSFLFSILVFATSAVRLFQFYKQEN